MFHGRIAGVRPSFLSQETGKKILVLHNLQSRSEPLTCADISGFYFLEAETEYKPDAELAKFLEEGEPPIYIG
jgi:hypothetical protein